MSPHEPNLDALAPSAKPSRRPNEPLQASSSTPRPLKRVITRVAAALLSLADKHTCRPRRAPRIAWNPSVEDASHRPIGRLAPADSGRSLCPPETVDAGLRFATDRAVRACTDPANARCRVGRDSITSRSRLDAPPSPRASSSICRLAGASTTVLPLRRANAGALRAPSRSCASRPLRKPRGQSARCSLPHESTSAVRLLAGTNEAIGKRLRAAPSAPDADRVHAKAELRAGRQ